MRPDELLEMTKEDFVYYSVKDGMLKTAPRGLQAEGYVKCNELRKNWNSTESFDEFLMGSLSLNRTDTMTKKSEIIWENFEKKFKLFGGLVHYHKFYKIILEKTIRKAIADGVKVLEVRRSLGRIFNDNCGKVYNQTVDMKSGTACIDTPSEMLSIKEELEIYREIIYKIKLDEPDFELFLIASSFKIFGHQHALTQISYYKYAIENGYSFVVGFDLVNEEDKYEPILFFTDELLDAKIKLKNIEYFFHTGESANRYNENLYDSVLLKAKRIGHSIPLTHHPYLMQLVKKYNIGIEICPISNWMLGYIHDPRWHPARQMIASKISITINSDIHTFFNHDALTTDFALAFLSWDLDLKDLKQLAINSIMYSSLLESQKYHHLLLFEKQWNVFITSFLKSQ